jgi:hypothetical protein
MIPSVAPDRRGVDHVGGHLGGAIFLAGTISCDTY